MTSLETGSEKPRFDGQSRPLNTSGKGPGAALPLAGHLRFIPEGRALRKAIRARPDDPKKFMSGSLSFRQSEWVSLLLNIPRSNWRIARIQTPGKWLCRRGQRSAKTVPSGATSKYSVWCAAMTCILPEQGLDHVWDDVSQAA